MSPVEVAVIDYGVGNLRSVRAALEHCGARVAVTDAPAVILTASHVVLPGVGAFGNGMSELRRRGLDQVAREAAARGVPLLGICLGMQMLLGVSEEFGVNAGLDLIPGRVVAMSTTDTEGRQLKTPHVGWNGLLPAQGRDGWRGSLLEDIRPGESVYFVHSFTAQPTDSRHRLADCRYGGLTIPAVIARDNVSGCQFHPEKSGVVGLNVLRRFLAS
ncbi:MAG: imidazole glycerol phosphate synthase subunit HisH [Sinobacteraceae bacterium]|nr:imidazole glycerol phosphate synthase subunit HisH [Nevskiaceae bacterium]